MYVAVFFAGIAAGAFVWVPLLYWIEDRRGARVPRAWLEREERRRGRG